MTEERWEGSKEQAEYIKREHDAVLDVLIAADMWTGNPPYRGVSAAGQVKMLVDRLATVTAERDALRAGLEERDDEHIHELGNVGLDLENAEHELAVWKPLLTAVCNVATRAYADVNGAIRVLLDTAMAVAVGADSVYEGVENDYDMNLRESALNRVCNQLQLSRSE